jgi:hypothetical protein
MIYWGGKMMNTQKHIDSLFSGYEETPALADFKEELRSNLDDRIANLIKKGATGQAAFAKAAAELGDVSALAEEISLKKKQEVFEDMYMGTRRFLNPKRTALYVLGGAVICFGLIVAAISWFTSGLEAEALGGAVFFCAGGAALLIFMGVTQETATKYPMSWKRAIFYAVSVGVFVFGVFVAPMAYFAVTGTELGAAGLVAGEPWSSPENTGFISAIGTTIPFILPSFALLVFLALTEKDRRKPWVIEQAKKYTEREAEYFANPAQAARFGILSAAVWIAAIAGFVVLAMTVGIRFSWLAVVAALVVQMLMLADFGGGRK